MGGIRDSIFAEAKENGGMFFVVPSIVMLDEELPLSAKVLYGVIAWKCGNYAYTWATNRDLGVPIDLSAKRVSALLSLLERHGHIETEIEYKDGTREILRRYIYPIMKSARTMLKNAPPPANEHTPPPAQVDLCSRPSIPLPENEEVICNIKENKDIPPYSPPEGDGAPADSDSEDKPVPKAGRPSRRFVPPDVEQVRSYCRERNNGIDPEAFVNYYASKGWTVGRAPMKDWKAAVRTWEQRRRSQRKDGGNDDDIFQ